VRQGHAILLAILVALLSGAAAFASARSQPVAEFGTPTYGVDGSATQTRGARTVPTWSSSFTFQAASYPYTIVGTAPQSGGTTTVPVELVPLRFVFSDGTVFDASTRAAAATASPIFFPAPFASGTTQYGDAIQRAEFWAVGGSGSYHVLLGAPAVAPTATINVPQHQGSVATNSRGVTVGRINDSWLSAQLHNLLVSGAPDPGTLPVFLADNVVYYEQDPSVCCGLGFHGASSSAGGNGKQKVLTWIFATWLTSGAFSQQGLADAAPLSHEVAEWMNDPFVVNATPPWSAPGYGCQNLLETGDPLVATTFPVGGYHLQDEAFLSWFARQTPSIAQGGRYTYLGTFTGPSTGC
jgi:hypothetical protein